MNPEPNQTNRLCYESQLSSMAKLLIVNEVRIGGLGGGRLQTDHFEALSHPIRVALVVDFETDVPGGNWVTVGFDSPWSVLRCAFGVSGMEGKRMQKWKEKIKGTDWSFGAGCTMGEGWRDKSVAWAGSLGRGQAMWSEALLGSCWEAKEPAG